MQKKISGRSSKKKIFLLSVMEANTHTLKGELYFTFSEHLRAFGKNTPNPYFCILLNLHLIKKKLQITPKKNDKRKRITP